MRNINSGTVWVQREPVQSHQAGVLRAHLLIANILHQAVYGSRRLKDLRRSPGHEGGRRLHKYGKSVISCDNKLPGFSEQSPEHRGVFIPNTSQKSKVSVAVCRCWKSGEALLRLSVAILFCSDRFPLCDNRHQMLMRQGCRVGPAQLDIRPWRPDNAPPSVSELGPLTTRSRRRSSASTDLAQSSLIMFAVAVGTGRRNLVFPKMGNS